MKLKMLRKLARSANFVGYIFILYLAFQMLDRFEFSDGIRAMFGGAFAVVWVMLDSRISGFFDVRLIDRAEGERSD